MDRLAFLIKEAHIKQTLTNISGDDRELIHKAHLEAFGYGFDRFCSVCIFRALSDLRIHKNKIYEEARQTDRVNLQSDSKRLQQGRNKKAAKDSK